MRDNMAGKNYNSWIHKKTIGLYSPILLILLLSVYGCEESLPPYAAPEDVYSASIDLPLANYNNIRMDMARIAAGVSPLSIEVLLENIYDETINGMTPQSLGKVEIWWKDDPNIKRTIDITPGHESQPSIFREYLPVTFDPGDIARFLINWYDWQDNRENYLWEYADDGEETRDDLHVYHNKKPMTFIAQAILIPITGGPTVYTAELEFVVTFYSVSGS